MMLGIEEVITRIRGEGIEITEQEVTHIVGQSWVLPRQDEGLLFFDEADTARLKLIVELRRDMEVNDEAVPVILNLLDQLYGLRQVFDEIREAVKALPPELRAEFERRLAAASHD